MTFYEDNRFVIGNTWKWEVVSYRLWKSTLLETITVAGPVCLNSIYWNEILAIEFSYPNTNFCYTRTKNRRKWEKSSEVQLYDLFVVGRVQSMKMEHR